MKTRNANISQSASQMFNFDVNATTLDLSYNKIGVEGARALALNLANVKCLTTLDLSYNKIGDEGARALALNIANAKCLTTLNLSYTNVGDEGARALALNLANAKCLTTLDLSGNKIGDEGARALALNLANQIVLVNLYGAGNGADISNLLQRNVCIQKSVRRSIITFLACRKFGKSHDIFLFWCPKEIIEKIARYLLSTRGDLEWKK